MNVFYGQPNVNGGTMPVAQPIQLMCTKEAGIIYRLDHLGNKVEELGYSSDLMNDTVKIAEDLQAELEKVKAEKEEYYDLLIANGILKKPKTQEEINRELTDMIMLLMKENETLTEQVKSIRKEEVEKDV